MTLRNKPGLWAIGSSRFRLAAIGAALLFATVAVSVQGPWTTPPGSNGKVRIASTAADALCVGGVAVSPASSACTGGVYSGTVLINGNAIASGSMWTYVTTTSTGTQNNFNPGIVGNTVIRANNATALTITGFAPTIAQVSGQMVLVQSINAQVNFTHQATSTAANQLFNLATSADTSILLGYTLYVYDGTTLRWRLVGHDQGSWITFVPSATASTGTWTVDSPGDIATSQYLLRGRTLFVSIGYSTTTTSNATASIGITIPGGFTANKQSVTAIREVETATDNRALWFNSGSGTTLTIQLASGNISALTNLLSIQGEIFFDVN